MIGERRESSSVVRKNSCTLIYSFSLGLDAATGIYQFLYTILRFSMHQCLQKILLLFQGLCFQ